MPRATVGGVQRRGGDQRDVDTGGGLVGELYRWFHEDDPYIDMCVYDIYRYNV